MGKEALSLHHKHSQWLESHKMLLLVPLFTCWLLYAKIQAVTHLIPQRLKLEGKLVPLLLGTFYLERLQMLWRSSGGIKTRKICCYPKVGLRWLEKKKCNLVTWCIFCCLWSSRASEEGRELICVWPIVFAFGKLKSMWKVQERRDRDRRIKAKKWNLSAWEKTRRNPDPPLQTRLKTTLSTDWLTCENIQSW